MLNTLFTKYATQTLLGILALGVLLCTAVIGTAIYMFMSSAVTTETTNTTSSKAPIADLIPAPTAGTVTNKTVTLDLKTTTVTFNYDKSALGEAAIQVADYAADYKCYEDGRRNAFVEFPNSDIKIDFNACGLGGISEVPVGKFTVNAKSGQKFTIGYSNCVNVKETYSDPAEYQRDLEAIGKTCRNYALSSYFDSKNINVNFMFETTVDKVPEVNKQIKAIVQSMVIKNK